MDPNVIQDILPHDGLSPQGAVLLAGIRDAWLRRLGERGQVAVLDAPCGRRSKRAAVERVRAERAERGRPAGGRPSRPRPA